MFSTILGCVGAALAVIWLRRQIPRDMKRHQERWDRMTPEQRADQQSWDAW